MADKQQTIRAEQKYIRTSSRKLKLVVDAIRQLSPVAALDQLAFIRKRAAEVVAKVIKQAIANAENNLNLKRENLKFKGILVKKGPTLKRGRAVSRGRTHPILKRTSHLEVILKEEAVKAEAGKVGLGKPKHKKNKGRLNKKDRKSKIVNKS